MVTEANSTAHLRSAGRRPGSPGAAWNRQLIVAFAAVTLSFIGASAFAHWRLLAVDRAALVIATNAAPSIERLAAARGEMRQMQLRLREYVDEAGSGTRPDGGAIGEQQRAMNDALADYLGLPPIPGERALWGSILSAKDRLNAAVTRCRAEVEHGDPPAAKAILHTEVAASAKDLGDSITRGVELNAWHSHNLALEIVQTRSRCMLLAFVLDGLCVGMAIAGGVVLRRALRAHWALAERHQALLEARASELEQFAFRIAHDILSPLTVLGFALQLAGRGADDKARTRSVERGTAALERVRTLVAGLLEFARAGAKPRAGAACEVGPTLADLWTELREAAGQMGAVFEVDVQVATAVACHPGILTSIVSNLALNAIKYIGKGARRRVQVRVLDRRRSIYFEVEDTGPGLDPALAKHVFEPYVRASDSSHGGIGLGLATVKRLVEAHAGQLGVHSVPGMGCTFWFELPAASEVRASPLPEPREPSLTTSSLLGSAGATHPGATKRNAAPS